MFQCSHLSGFGAGSSSQEWVGYTWVAPTIQSLTVGQCNIFVGGAGASDSNNGLSEGSPKATIAGGRSAAVTYGTGAKIYVKAGTYTETGTTNYGLGPSTAINWDWMFEDGVTVNLSCNKLAYSTTNTVGIYGYGILNHIADTTSDFAFHSNGSAGMTIYCKSAATTGLIFCNQASTGLIHFYATEDITVSTNSSTYGLLYGTGGTFHCRDITYAGNDLVFRTKAALTANYDATFRKLYGGTSGVNYSAFYFIHTTTPYLITVTGENMEPNGAGGGFMFRLSGNVTTDVKLVGCDVKCKPIASYGAFYLGYGTSTLTLDGCRIRKDSGNTYNIFDNGSLGNTPNLVFQNDCRLTELANDSDFAISGTYLTNAGTW